MKPNANFKAIMIQAPEAFLSMSLMKNELYNKSYKTCAHVPTELNKNEAKKWRHLSSLWPFSFCLDCNNSFANNVLLLMRSFPKPQCTQTER